MTNSKHNMNYVVITGASSGLGHAIATEYAKRGWRVGIAARRSDRLALLQKEYPELIEYERIDITEPGAPCQLMKLITKLGGMDIFIQAAGVGRQNPQLEQEIERPTLMTNCIGFTAMLDTAFKYFTSTQRNTPGHIVAITSIAGTKGLGMAASYSASKRYESTYIDALEQLSHIKNVKLKFTDIRPGFIATDLLNKANHYPLLMSVSDVVPRIIRAIDRHKRVAIINRRWWWVVQAWRCIPRCLWIRVKATTRTHDKTATT